jgi:hypothetical protein
MNIRNEDHHREIDRAVAYALVALGERKEAE